MLDGWPYRLAHWIRYENIKKTHIKREVIRLLIHSVFAILNSDKRRFNNKTQMQTKSFVYEKCNNEVSKFKWQRVTTFTKENNCSWARFDTFEFGTTVVQIYEFGSIEFCLVSFFFSFPDLKKEKNASAYTERFIIWMFKLQRLIVYDAWWLLSAPKIPYLSPWEKEQI